MKRLPRAALAPLAALLLGLAAAPALARDPLPSWNDGPAKRAIVGFVRAVTKEGGPRYVPPSERIATFDNDGTLWVEQPLYTQLVFAIDRVEALAPEHPAWKTEPPYAAVLAGDPKAALSSGTKGMLQLVMATHAGMTAEQFSAAVTDWIGRARHPRFQRLYTECVYQPQLELLRYLRANGFATFIVSGGGIEFMRPWTDAVYGVPPQQVVGSSVVTKFEIRDGEPVLVRQPEVDFVDDGAGKPVGIHRHIGRRPILAFGNSDGDMQMLQYTSGGEGARLGLVLHHTDAVREYAYDRKSPIGRLDEVLDRAAAEGFVVVDMKRDWKVVFPFDAD